MATQVNVGLFVRLEALPGKEDDVAAFLDQGLALVQQELFEQPNVEQLDVLAEKPPQ